MLKSLCNLRDLNLTQTFQRLHRSQPSQSEPVTLSLVSCAQLKVLLISHRLSSGARAEANMAAKAGDNPDSLMTLSTIFCLRNLRKTVCYQGFGNKLCLRPDIFLPSEICDKLVNKYVPTGHFLENRPAMQ